MKRASAAPTVALAAVLLAACGEPQRILDVRSPEAERIAALWWLMLAIAVAVCLIVAVMMALAIRAGRRRERGLPARAVRGRALIWGAGVVGPALILLYVLVETVRVGADVGHPHGVLWEEGGLGPPPDDGSFVVDVIGHQFWWEVRYPQHGIVSANEIHIPAGRRVLFRVTSPDVIHSFWVPQLHGKIDLIPGRINFMRATASAPGLFRGQCAEYCGMSHALMAFWVEAMDPAAFEAWVQRRRGVQTEPPDGPVARGREVFFEAGCGECHATRGAPLPRELGSPGPDLADFGARRTLAAGILPNNRGNLAGWISDPDRIKPGVRMPPTALEPERLRALLDYLESLR
jgi:cytochrome c oxidase subunit II